MSANKTALTLSTLALTLGFGTAVQAKDEIALSFALSPTVQDDAVTVPDEAIAVSPLPEEAPVTEPMSAIADAPLPVPIGAENPPMSGDTSWPAGVYGGVDALALGNGQSVQDLLPAPPPAPALRPVPAVDAVATAPSPVEDLNLFPPEEIDDLLALSLDLKPRHQTDAKAAVAQNSASSADSQTVAVAKPQPATQTYAWGTIQSLFDGGTDSLVARAVGSAEGTRTPEGHKNPAYFGHTDPGNQVWNLGTFSYQHGAKTPEEADEKQLKRLQRQTKVLSQKAQEKGLTLSPEELLNGIDLANQAPLAALDRGGYIDWLKEAQALGMTGAEAIVWARTRSFIDPDTQRWNAPGLGNNIYSISHDQERRANAIARAMNVTGFVAPIMVSAVSISGSDNSIPPETAVVTEEAVEFGLSLDLTDSFMQASTAISQSEGLPVSVSSSSAQQDAPTPTPAASEPPEPLTLEADSLSSSLTESSLTDPGDETNAAVSQGLENSDNATLEKNDVAVPADVSSVVGEAEPLQLADHALLEATVVPTIAAEDSVDPEDIADVGHELPELPVAWQQAADQPLTDEKADDERSERADISSAIAPPESEGDSTADIDAAWAIAGTKPDWLSDTADQAAGAVATNPSANLDAASPQPSTLAAANAGFSPPLVMAPMRQSPAENFADLLEAEKTNADRSKSQPISALSETLKALDVFQQNEL